MLATFSPTTTYEVAIYSETGSLHILNLRANTHELLFKNISLTAMSYTGDGRFLTVAFRDGSINQVDMKGNITIKQHDTFHQSPITQLCSGGLMSNDGLMLSVSQDLTVLWSEVSFGLITKMQNPSPEIFF
jgi:WD40 repeat protein